MPDLSLIAWAALALGAVTVGISKTAIPGANIAVALFAAVLPAKPSTAALLVLLIVADVFAVLFYRRDADWRMLRRLAPPVMLGLAVGAVFLSQASNDVVSRVIAVILIGVITLGLVQRQQAKRRERAGAGAVPAAAAKGAASAPAVEEPEPAARSSWWQSIFYGSLGGFTTMVANAAGPVMSMYFLAARLPIATFLGTSAWFYLIFNLSKVPFSAGLGLFSVELLLLDLVLIPFVVGGAVLGRAIVHRVNRTTFEWTVIVLSVVGALYLLVR